MNITIIGLGVIGGSLGLAIKQNVSRSIITGFDNKKSVESALRRDAIDFGALSLTSAVRDADIVFLCAPVSAILSLLPKISSSIKPNVIVTDVGSTKARIVSSAKKYFHNNGIFIGGHPMAGSEGKGIEFADALMFQNATYVLCTDAKHKKKISSLTSLLHSIGARVLFLSADAHDAIAASISHLPQLIAVGMMNLVGKKNKSHHGYLQLAAGGFRDITRIASSPYGMWNDILAGNSAQIAKTVNEFAALLNKFARDVQSPKGRAKFAQRFASAKQWRDAIPKNSKGFLYPLFDIYVTVEDKPGVLAKLTSALYKAKINIKDIELLKIRDGRGGAFRLSFNTKNEAVKAEKVLGKLKIKVK
ncbi:MAG: prephenate dehydrogenase [Bacteroidetes bacterium]|nr:prephenate dehydrogenase [Bacteroidota bacterium]